MKEILGIIGILVLLVVIYSSLRKFWIQRILDQKRNAKKPRKPVEMRPKSEAAGFAWQKRGRNQS